MNKKVFFNYFFELLNIFKAMFFSSSRSRLIDNGDIAAATALENKANKYMTTTSSTAEFNKKTIGADLYTSKMINDGVQVSLIH